MRRPLFYESQRNRIDKVFNRTSLYIKRKNAASTLISLKQSWILNHNFVYVNVFLMSIKMLNLCNKMLSQIPTLFSFNNVVCSNVFPVDEFVNFFLSFWWKSNSYDFYQQLPRLDTISYSSFSVMAISKFNFYYNRSVFFLQYFFFLNDWCTSLLITDAIYIFHLKLRLGQICSKLLFETLNRISLKHKIWLMYNLFC